MKKGICYIIGAGENYGLNINPSNDDYVIAVDGGLEYCREANLEPDLIIGDFDSLGYCPQQGNVIKLNTKKDDTDMLSALKEGLKKDYDIFYILCGTGGRFDHTLANIQLLAFLAEKKKKGYLFDKENVTTSICDDCIEFSKVDKGYISVFSYSKISEGVCLEGLMYPLNNAVLSNTYPLGVSNEFTGKESKVSVERGTLIVVFQKEIIGKI